jgi:carbonic anhydrase/acetyltransferase-like protein (isoleucine patch superfamily)
MPVFSLGERRVEFRGEHHFIAHNAVLAGSVVLENEVSVWYGVVIRGDNDRIHIGAQSNIQVGAGTLIGANTLIAEGKEIPPGVLVVGSPGKVPRELRPEERALLEKIAAGYVERGKLLRRELREQPLPPSAR